MSVSDTFKNAVKQGNTTRVRIILKNSMLIDPTLSKFNEMLIYATNRMNLYDKHDKRELIDDPSKWNKKYLSQEMARVVYNFSEERIDLLKKMVQHLYKSEIESSRINNQHTSKTQISNKPNENKYIALYKKVCEVVDNGVEKLCRAIYGDKNKDNQIESICEYYDKIIKIIGDTNSLDAKKKHDVNESINKIIENCEKILKSKVNLRSNKDYRISIDKEIKQQLSNIEENISKYNNSIDSNKNQMILDIAQSAFKIQTLLK